MALEAILKRHWKPAGTAGGKAVKAPMLAELEQHRGRMRFLYLLLFAITSVLALVAALSLLFLWRNGGKPSVAALAGAGITVPAMLELMRRVGREWSRTELVCNVARHSTDAEIQKWIEKLLGVD
jgi:hypothetical protein